MKIFIAILVVAAIAAAALPIDDRHSAAGPHAEATATPTPSATPTPAPVRDVRRSHCDAGVPDCHTVRGTVVYVEHVDPDGDGDLHVVVAAGSITLPGMTAVDVAIELRPKQDPEIGDRVSAAGPVQTGSHEQEQIHALEFHVRHR